MKRSLTAAVLSGILALGLVGTGATAAMAGPTMNTTCMGWGITSGTMLGGPFKGWTYAKNTSKTTLVLKIYEPGNIYQLVTAPGKTYYFESPNTRIYCG
ncbi:hypothetical protein [Cellulomonas hominis]|uniref:hypothetical protein n=1 Tax=Cellulomonas hominis TaxID=156981 RepID=UPI001B94A1FA|nr:hypothetical protein [Cellulomonas hominis]VTR77623.1 hypothetical protein CHMI_02394 [Cellulomonas hominis]